jgi:hypothetical protein
MELPRSIKPMKVCLLMWLNRFRATLNFIQNP